MGEPDRSVPASVYSQDYFLTECEGHAEYTSTGGDELPHRVLLALHEAGIEPGSDLDGQCMLDLGCGRGELVRHLAAQHAQAIGIDYSADALALSACILGDDDRRLSLGDATRLPFLDDSFDMVFALDIVEHLYPDQLLAALTEVKRVLRPGGRLLVHTMPNIWYYRYGYPLYRLFQRVRGVHLPADPRDRWRYVKHVHVNEQSVASLGKALRQAGLRGRIRLRNAQSYVTETNRAARFVYRLLSTIYPFAWIFCNDIFAIATKSAW